MVFKVGDRVRITYEENTLDAEIFLACTSGLSITVTFNGRLGNYTGLMPLMWIEDHYVDLVNGRQVKLSRMGRVIPWPGSTLPVAQSK
jgi:hypothetical protein